ncbi:phosphoribosyltransferase [Rhizobium sp. 18065]|uniref:phosphoribosyltransferase n=1 Tax=Rhizobium sp. 18065 TaxID=2681411 RepID=UPI00135794AF|nr:phosphoribosyltransferase [Rhizobium sp. 18065]
MQPHNFWQEFHPPGSFPGEGPFADFFPASLGDGRQLRLPIRALADGRHGLASLIINQAGFVVQDALAAALAEKLKHLNADVIIGLPTLGLTLAAAVSRALGHSRYVPLGTSRKFWYVDDLSVSLTSITTPDQVKRLYVDPRMLPLIEGKRVVLIDDVVSSGSSMRAGLELLTACGVEPVALGVAMAQSMRWRDHLTLAGRDWSNAVLSVFQTPRLVRGDHGGWLLEG